MSLKYPVLFMKAFNCPMKRFELFEVVSLRHSQVVLELLVALFLHLHQPVPESPKTLKSSSKHNIKTAVVLKEAHTL